MTKVLQWLLIIGIIVLFIFLRFNNLSQSFFFWNDMGRDATVLQNWIDSGKPPLLGPQTSALPFNQSAIYFYLLYPGFVLSQSLPVSALYTLALIYLIIFTLGLYLLRRQPAFQKIIFIVFGLISIHPQYVEQSRFVWNPSFVSPFILISLISFHFLLKQFSNWRLWLFSLNLALSVSLSYSIAPLMFALIIYWLIFSRQYFLKIFISLALSFLFFNLPTIVFELRHQFLLTTALFTKPSPTQGFLSFSDRLYRLSQYLFSSASPQLNIILLLFFTLLSLFTVIKLFKTPQKMTFLSSFLLLILILQAFIIPVSIQAHYVFAYLCLIFLIIATQPILIKTPIILLFIFLYLSPFQLGTYFKKAPRTYSELKNCLYQYCQQEKSPVFVTVQSKFHPFHHGPEHRFLMRQAGCQVREIETDPSSASKMAVVLDSGSFDDRTTYYELDLFGKFHQTNSFQCLPNLSVITLEKI